MRRACSLVLFSIVIATAFEAYPSSTLALRTQRAHALLAIQSGTFQRPTPAPVQDSRSLQCMRRTADWERNRTPLSLFFGFIIFLVVLYAVTLTRIGNSIARVIISFAVAAIVGPAIMAFIVQDALKVCMNPPGYLGSLTAPLFAWTFVGSLGTLLVIWVLRYFVVSRKFRQDLPSA